MYLKAFSCFTFQMLERGPLTQQRDEKRHIFAEKIRQEQPKLRQIQSLTQQHLSNKNERLNLRSATKTSNFHNPHIPFVNSAYKSSILQFILMDFEDVS